MGATGSLEQLCQDVVDQGIYGRCMSLFVAHEGRVVVDVTARASGAPGPERPLYVAYCLTKPFLALAIGHLVDAGRLSLDTTLDDLVPGWGLGVLTVRDVLCHDAGLGEPPAFVWRMHRPAERDALLRDAPAPSPGTAAYSEVRGWRLMEMVITALTGCDASTFVQETVLTPLALHDVRLHGEPAMAAQRAGRIEVPVAGLPVTEVPMLTECLAVTAAQTRPCFGGYVSTADMGHLYASMNKVLAGEAIGGLPTRGTLTEMLATRRGRRWDEVIRKECSFACGFMVELQDHGLTTRASPDAFGHLAGLSPAFALADPGVDLAVAFSTEGATSSPEELQSFRRQVTGLVYEQVRGG